MQNKKIIILIIGIMVIGGLTASYILLNNQKKETGQPITTTLKEFLPFGTSSKVENGQTDGNGQVVDENGEVMLMEKFNLKKLTNFGIAGAVFFEELRPKTLVNEESGPDFEIIPSVRYVEKANGHLYQQNLKNNSESKISNTTIPSIYEVVFSSNLKSLIFRYLSSDRQTISSYLGNLGEAEGEFLPENISSLVVSPDKNKFFYLSPFSGGVNGTIRNFNDTKKSQIFTSSFSEWIPQWATPQTIYLTTKASSRIPGYVYSLNTSNGSFNKVFGGVSGLTTLVSPDGSMILYSSSTSSGPKLLIYNMKDRSNTQTGLFGLPEKCVWNNASSDIYCGIPSSATSTEPDSWYQGLTSFNDGFVKINAFFGSYINIDTNLSDSIDAVNLFLDKKEETLFFTNKTDSAFWSLGLN